MRTAREIVSDTSPIISLEKIPDGFEFIRKLYDVVYIPPAVLDELAADTFESGNEYLRWYSLKSLLHVRRPTQEIPSEVSSLDLGEQEAITLAVELDLPLLIEEEAGRRIARRLDLPISGIAGQIHRAVHEEVIVAEYGRTLLHALWEAGRISNNRFEQVAASLGEGNLGI